MSPGNSLDKATLEIPIKAKALKPTLHKLGNDEPAGLWITSLPWKEPQSKGAPSLHGRPTHAVPLGQWPDRPDRTDSNDPAPRRWLLIADGQDQAPQQLDLHTDNPAPTHSPPEARMVRFKHNDDDPAMYWENHMLCLTFGDRTVGLALGLRHQTDDIHWWEACNLVITERTEHCITLEMGGAIPAQMYGIESFDQDTHKVAHPWVHRHNWLNGHLFVRAHSNGVCEVYAHHINAKFFDDGAELKDVVPIIGMRTWEGEAPADQIDDEPASSPVMGADAAPLQSLLGPWDGSKADLALGNVRFDLGEASLLASEEQPGQMSHADNMLIWQPYMGMEIYGGTPCAARLGDPYICHAEEHRVPRGAARTVSFSLSLSQRSPRIARYLADPWWYGHLEELYTFSALPVSNDYDENLDLTQEWVDTGIVRRGFEVGGMPQQQVF